MFAVWISSMELSRFVQGRKIAQAKQNKSKIKKLPHHRGVFTIYDSNDSWEWVRPFDNRYVLNHRVFLWNKKYVRLKFVVYKIMLSQFGRAVKASDLKSDGLYPRRFKSCSWRFYFFTSFLWGKFLGFAASWVPCIATWRKSLITYHCFLLIRLFVLLCCLCANLDYVRPNEEVPVMYYDQMGVYTKVPEPISVICLPVKDDKSIYAIHYKSNSGKYPLLRSFESRRAILYSHGNAIDLGLCIDAIQFLGEKLDSDIYFYDYEGYGCNQGRACAKYLPRDLRALYDYVRKSFDGENIYFYGESSAIFISILIYSWKRSFLLCRSSVVRGAYWEAAVWCDSSRIVVFR